MLWTELARRRHAGLVGRLRERERDLAAVEELLEHHGGVLLIEGRAGIGKTSLVEAACSRAGELGHEVVHARGSELESGFAFGVVRQLFERRLAVAGEGERAALLAGPAAAVRPLLSGEVSAQPAGDSSFAVLHGLYWLVVNLATATASTFRSACCLTGCRCWNSSASSPPRHPQAEPPPAGGQPDGPHTPPG
jgi:AAA ATPase domain